MTPRKRQILAWTASTLTLAAVLAAWRGSHAPVAVSQPSKSPALATAEPLDLKLTKPAAAMSTTNVDLSSNPTTPPEMLDWTPPIAPLRRISPPVAEEGILATDLSDAAPQVRQKPATLPAQTAKAPLPSPLNGPNQAETIASRERGQFGTSADERSEETNSPLRRLVLAPQEPPAADLPEAVPTPPPGPPINPFDCWWQAGVPKSLRPGDQKWSVELDDLLALALEHSDLVHSMRIEPLIQQTEIALEAAAFDPAAFVDSKWNDLSDPVGNTLTTGNGSRRLNDHDLETKTGLRQRNRVGGRLEAAQEISLRNTNSTFFQPKDQANTRLVLSYTQPLMRGRGRCYNEGFVVLAQIDTDIARRQLQQRLQDHLLDVAEAYWTLYLERARLVQQRSALERTAAIQEELEARAEIDVVRSQILRARGAVAQRKSAVKRAEVGVRNQEATVWSLTNAPDLANRKHVEILPANGPDCRPLPVTSAGSVTEAIGRRAEIAVVFEKIHAAQTRLGIAEHELLPTLNLVMETYVRGLDGDFDVGRSLSKQFDTGAPSYAIGLSFLMPYGNAAAKANLSRRQLEMSQLAYELNATLKRVTVEVENSLRDIEAAQVSVVGNREAMEAATAELDYLLDRWRMLPGEDRLASLLLDEALGALDRMVASESSYAQSQVDYALAITRYKRAAGMLLQAYPVSPDRIETQARESDSPLLNSTAPKVDKTARRPQSKAR